MDEIKWTVRAKPADLLALKDKIVAGDREAARLYVLSAAWQRIKTAAGYSGRVKIKTLRELAGIITVNIEWQTPTPA